MRPVNTLIPSLGTNFYEVFEYVTKATPICLYTYETCNANYNRDGLYVEDRDDNSGYKYDLVKKAVTEAYGHNKMDNKITLHYSVPYDINGDGDFVEVDIYVTFWDGRISISSTVFFFREITGHNAYRIVMPQPKVVGRIELPEDDSFKWHRGVDGGLYEDYEQSIGE